ncbi:hypothetical protein [uncultured Gammaproteobacteria bacterium]|nr:hypothetical protein [uncultured Gammaproteobacteria bacterium]
MRANMVEKATEYQYSGTAYHCGLVANNIITCPVPPRYSSLSI